MKRCVQSGRLAAALALASLSLSIAACGKKDPPIEAEARATPAPSPAPSEAPTAAPTSSSISRAIEDPSPAPPRISDKVLSLGVMDGRGDKEQIWDVGGKMVVTPSFSVLSDGKLVPPGEGFEPSNFLGEDNQEATTGANWITVMRLMGRYPNDLWVYAEGVFGFFAARTDFVATHSYMYQRQYGRFGRVDEQPVAAVPWTRGRTLAYLDTNKFKLAQPAKKALAELPKQEPGKSCPTRVAGMALATLPDGEVLLLGTDCDNDGRLALERWEKDAGDGQALAKSRVLPLPGPEKKATRAWLFANAKATFAVADIGGRALAIEIKGEEARELALPIKQISEAHMAADATLFVYGDNALYRYEGAQGEAPLFTRAALPPKLKVKETSGLFAESADSVYLSVLMEDDYTSLLLSSTSSAPLPASLTGSPAPGSTTSLTNAELLDLIPALSGECKTPFVVLFPVSRSTPKDFVFPQTKATLKDFAGRASIKVIDFQHRGARFVGVVAPDVKTAESLVLHWNQRDQKSKSRLACLAAPDTAREVILN
jgi:hypothetical protein